MSSSQNPARDDGVSFLICYKLLNFKMNIWECFSPVFPLLAKAFPAYAKLWIITSCIFGNKSINGTFIALVPYLIKKILRNLFSSALVAMCYFSLVRTRSTKSARFESSNNFSNQTYQSHNNHYPVEPEQSNQRKHWWLVVNSVHSKNCQQEC